MRSVRQSTLEKPLTAVDYISDLAALDSLAELAAYAVAIPVHIVGDARFAQAFYDRLKEIQEPQ